jgi:hypothetical protein
MNSRTSFLISGLDWGRDQLASLGLRAGPRSEARCPLGRGSFVAFEEHDVQGGTDETEDRYQLTAGGWLVTALLIMLGAPFWFGVLSKLVSLRAAGERPPKASGQEDSATAKAARSKPR